MSARVVLGSWSAPKSKQDKWCTFSVRKTYTRLGRKRTLNTRLRFFIFHTLWYSLIQRKFAAYSVRLTYTYLVLYTACHDVSVSLTLDPVTAILSAANNSEAASPPRDRLVMRLRNCWQHTTSGCPTNTRPRSVRLNSPPNAQKQASPTTGRTCG